MRVCLPPILVLACSAMAVAQPLDRPANPQPDAPPAEPVMSARDASASTPATVSASTRPETHIYSDTVELGIKTRSALYRGNVRLEDPRIHLTCEQLSADVPQEGNRVERVVAQTNVVVLLIDEQGRTNRAYADQAVYTYSVSGSVTNEQVELTGHPSPRIERQEGTLYGDVIIWDRIRNQIRATNQRMIYRTDAVTGTNSVPEATTRPPTADNPGAISRPATAEGPAADSAIPDE